MLIELGHVPVGPATRLDAGIEMATSGTFDLAILDVNLGGTRSFPIADVLKARGIPVIFATGYGAGGLDPGYERFPVMVNPFSLEALVSTLKAVGTLKARSVRMPRHSKP
jgi:DNA-binding response OmpR family regulator